MKLLSRRVNGGATVSLSTGELAFLRVVLQSYMQDLQNRAVNSDEQIADGVSLADAAIKCFVDAKKLENEIGRWLTGSVPE